MDRNKLKATALLGSAFLGGLLHSPMSQNIQDNILTKEPSISEVQNQDPNYCPIEKPLKPFQEEVDFGDLATDMERNQETEREADIAEAADRPIACGSPDPYAATREVFGNSESIPEDISEPVESQETMV